MASTVHVKDIAHDTSEQEVRDFFSFCGKISSLTLTPTTAASDSTKSATVTFEKETAAKTALLLDSTQLGSAQVHVSAASGTGEATGTSLPTTSADTDKDGITQEDKPRSRIVAEYLAHGYVISDKAIEQALALDGQHGISAKFAAYIKTFDDKTQASTRAATVDTKLGLTEKAMASWAGLNSYFDKALDTPTGQKLRSFYETGNKQVMDVHNEARHLADLKNGKFTPEKVPGSETKTHCGCGGGVDKCGCQPGNCACSTCPRNTDVAGSSMAALAADQPIEKKPAA